MQGYKALITTLLTMIGVGYLSNKANAQKPKSLFDYGTDKLLLHQANRLTNEQLASASNVQIKKALQAGTEEQADVIRHLDYLIATNDSCFKAEVTQAWNVKTLTNIAYLSVHAKGEIQGKAKSVMNRWRTMFNNIKNN